MYKDVQHSIFKYFKNVKQYGNDTANCGTATQWNTLQPCQSIDKNVGISMQNVYAIMEFAKKNHSNYIKKI